MASSGAQSIAVDECMALDFVGEIAQQHKVGFIGNFHVTAALFDETEDVRSDVQRCLNDGGSFPGYVFGLGGPIVQHIHVARLEEAVATYRNTQFAPHDDRGGGVMNYGPYSALPFSGNDAEK